MSEVLEVLPRRASLTYPPIRVRCRCGRVYTTVQPASAVEHRESCQACADGWDAEAAKQTLCAGYEGSCPTSAEPPARAFRKSVIRARQGRPWRCTTCAGRMAWTLRRQERA